MRLAARFTRMAARLVRPEWLRALASQAGLQTLEPPRSLALPPGELLMVLAPHPDDESIGCGGLIVRWRQAGRAALVVFLTDGESGQRTLRSTGIAPEALRLGQQQLAGVRRREAAQALEALGGAEAVHLSLPDGRLMRNLPALTDALAHLFERRRPDVIALPFLTDRHPDHVACAAATVAAFAASGGSVPSPVEEASVLGYEVWAPLPVNVTLDISDVMEAKLTAIRCHASQMAEHDYAEGAQALNRYRAIASLTGARHAEAYWSGTPRMLADVWADCSEERWGKRGS